MVEDQQVSTRWTTWLFGLMVAVVWIWVAILTVPQAISPGIADYGFFTAIAERLRAGDRLYVGVWDNKDPLVYYSIALARTFGPLGAWMLEFGWVALASVSTLLFAKKVNLSGRLAAMVGLVLGPFVILGYPYFMGTTHLPGIALTMSALALLLWDRPLLAGIAVGLVLFVKLIMGPLALILAVLVMVLRGKRPALTRFLAGLGGLVVVFAGVMALRGELVDFAATQVLNMQYSQAPIVSPTSTGVAQKIAQHLVILVNPHVFVILVATSVVLLVLGWRRRDLEEQVRWRYFSKLWWLVVAAVVVEVMTIFLSGKWLPHAEIFAVSSLLVLILLAGSLSIEMSVSGWVTVVIATLVTFLLAGLPSPNAYADSAKALRTNWAAARATDPLTEILQGLEPTSLAYVGVGSLTPRTGGLDGWSIACRHIAQRPFEPESTFNETLACLPSAGTIVVGEDKEPKSPFPAYNLFLTSVSELVSKEYDCKDYTGLRTFRVCRKKTD